MSKSIKQCCLDILASSDLNKVTEKSLREMVVDELKLPREKLTDDAFKNEIKQIINEFIEKPSKHSKSINLYKSYIVKCGIRKVWKKELDGLNEKQIMNRLKEILEKEAGIEGRPTLQKCKEAKRRREEESELNELKNNVILDTKLRRNRE